MHGILGMLYCQTNPAEIISRIFDRSERHPALQRLGDVQQNSGRYPEAGVSEPSTPVDAKTCEKIRPHRRCWGVIFRMALVKRLQVYLGGGGIFRPKPPVFDRS